MTDILFTGGGTAGHVIPVIPLIEQLSDEGIEMAFIGTASGFECELLKSYPVDYYSIPSGKLRRYFSLKNITDVFRVLSGILKSYILLGRLRPRVVFSKGGFVSFPVVFAARLRGIPVLLHESDVTPGLANKLSMPFADKLYLNFPEASSGRFSGHTITTGTPIRKDLLFGDPIKGRQVLGIPENQPLLLVTGGSLGADFLNRTVRSSLPNLIDKFWVVHICGRGRVFDTSEARYIQFEYLDKDWGDILAAADLVVSRAGANIVYELLVLGKPNLLIPLSRKSSRGDQIENANYAKKNGYSSVILEEDLDPEHFVSKIDKTWARLAEFREHLTHFEAPNSVSIICEELHSYLQKN